MHRFRDGNKKATAFIGPGQYEVNKRHNEPKSLSSCFKTQNKTTLEKLIKEKNKIPAPGSYEKDVSYAISPKAD